MFKHSTIDDLPYDPKLEKAVLGGILLNGDLIEDVIHILGKNPEDAFFDSACRQIFVTILSLRRKGEDINPFSVIEELKIGGKIDKVGGEEFVLSLPSYIPSAAFLDNFTRRLKEKMILRKLSQKMKTFLEEISWGVSNTWEFISKVEKEISEIAQETVSQEFYSISDIRNFVSEEVIGDEYHHAIPTCFPSLDEKIVGFHPGDFVIIAGRPGMGKTSFALSIAYYMATEKIPVMFFSIEMPIKLILLRILSMHSGIPLQRIISKNLSDLERSRIVNSANEISKLPMFFNDSVQGITQIRSLSKRARDEKGVKAVFIDYLQQIFVEWKVERREEEISTISRLLKSLAKELKIPVVALSQLSREPERRGDNKRPQLSDLRESGSLEQDADLVLMLYRDHYYNPCQKSVSASENENFDCCERARIAEIIIAKNRNGPTGTVLGKFIGENCIYEDIKYSKVAY
ncbi:MAG: replicative DNA helicase [Candidatus Calescibacterium sp.]|nr:replicative DNA helicase [Candidatus Calescibacterium sp.]MDW8086836.1 replicative DNA helicase [Candidatus Calescibacterium sp.]